MKELFNYLANEHNLILTNEELEEITRIVEKMKSCDDCESVEDLQTYCNNCMGERI